MMAAAEDGEDGQHVGDDREEEEKLAQNEALLAEAIGPWMSTYRAVSIRIGRPEKVIAGGLQKNFVVYPVISEDVRSGPSDDLFSSELSQARASRRYSEFEEIRDRLQRRFGEYGLLVPSLPPKSGLFGTSESLVQRRVGALALFCRRVAENPFLGRDDEWVHFLGRTTPSTALSQQRWFEYIRELSDASAADLNGVADELASYETSQEQARRAVERLCQSVAKAAEDAETCRIDAPADAREAFVDLYATLVSASRSAAHLEDLAAHEARQAKELRNMVLVKLPQLEKMLVAARDKWAKAGDNGLATIVSQRQRVLRDYRAALVHWTLPKYREEAKAAQLTFAKHARLLANLLGARPLASYEQLPPPPTGDSGADLTAAV